LVKLQLEGSFYVSSSIHILTKRTVFEFVICQNVRLVLCHLIHFLIVVQQNMVMLNNLRITWLAYLYCDVFVVCQLSTEVSPVNSYDRLIFDNL
jgi:hypothetical protein